MPRGEMNKPKPILLCDCDKLSAIYRNSGVQLQDLCTRMNTTRGTINVFFYEAKTIPMATAQKLAKIFHCEIADFTHPMPENMGAYTALLKDDELDVSYEQLRNGIRANIEQRLLLTYSHVWVNQILELIDDLTLESQYYGVEKKNYGEEKQIVEKIQAKRRYR